MGKKLYVGNLSYDVSSSDLEKLLAPPARPVAPLLDAAASTVPAILQV